MNVRIITLSFAIRFVESYMIYVGMGIMWLQVTLLGYM